jgi:hypothetical protein
LAPYLTSSVSFWTGHVSPNIQIHFSDEGDKAAHDFAASVLRHIGYQQEKLQF